jgi:hypothetical protein
MALSTCGKCGWRFWEIAQVEPRDSRFKICLVQCAKCGTPVGAMEYDNIGTMLEKQNEAIKKIAAQLGVGVNL